MLTKALDEFKQNFKIFVMYILREANIVSTFEMCRLILETWCPSIVPINTLQARLENAANLAPCPILSYSANLLKTAAAFIANLGIYKGKRCLWSQNIRWNKSSYFTWGTTIYLGHCQLSTWLQDFQLIIILEQTHQ